MNIKQILQSLKSILLSRTHSNNTVSPFETPNIISYSNGRGFMISHIPLLEYNEETGRFTVLENSFVIFYNGTNTNNIIDDGRPLRITIKDLQTLNFPHNQIGYGAWDKNVEMMFFLGTDRYSFINLENGNNTFEINNGKVNHCYINFHKGVSFSRIKVEYL